MAVEPKGYVEFFEVWLDKKEKVVSVKVIEGEHVSLTESAVDAVKKWKYKPFMKDGVPKKVRFTVILNFKVK